MADTKHDTLSGAAQSTMHGAAHAVDVYDVAPKDVGGAPTAPGQTEVVAGTVEHQQLLKSFPNATSYAPDVNVILPPEPTEEQLTRAIPPQTGVPTDIPVVPPNAKPDTKTSGSTIHTPDKKEDKK